jgi:hypothetical protein
MKDVITILQLLGGLALLFAFGDLVGRVLKLDTRWEDMQKAKRIRNSKYLEK